jgi:hypothetical protein
LNILAQSSEINQVQEREREVTIARNMDAVTEVIEHPACM